MIPTLLALGSVYFAQQSLEQKLPNLIQVPSVHLRLCMMLSRFFAHNFVQPVANGQRRRKTLKPILYDEVVSSLLHMNIIVYQVIADEESPLSTSSMCKMLNVCSSDSGGKFHFQV